MALAPALLIKAPLVEAKTKEVPEVSVEVCTPFRVTFPAVMKCMGLTHVLVPMAMFPAIPVSPICTRDHPSTSLPSSVLERAKVPVWESPTPMLVAGALVVRIRVPVPVRFAPILISESVLNVRLLAPMVWIPLTFRTPAPVCRVRGSLHVWAATFMTPAPSVRPRTILLHPSVKRLSSVSLRARVPVCPVPTAKVVAAAEGAMVRMPVPVSAALIVRAESVWIVRLLAPMVWIPLIVRTPEPVRSVRGSFQVRAATLSAFPVVEEPMTILLHPSVIRPNSASLRARVPVCPVPTPMETAPDCSMVRMPVPVKAALIVKAELVLKDRSLAPVFWAPFTVISPFPVRNTTESFHVRAPTFIVPVALVAPKVMALQPLVRKSSSVLVSAKVPVSPVPIARFVPVEAPRMLKRPVPVRAAPIARLEFVFRVRLLVPVFCAPLMFIAPAAVLNSTLSSHV